VTVFRFNALVNVAIEVKADSLEAACAAASEALEALSELAGPDGALVEEMRARGAGQCIPSHGMPLVVQDDWEIVESTD
jgi:hypothetical protein